jgi:hypothetical protein
MIPLASAELQGITSVVLILMPNLPLNVASA